MLRLKASPSTVGTIGSNPSCLLRNLTTVIPSPALSFIYLSAASFLSCKHVGMNPFFKQKFEQTNASLSVACLLSCSLLLDPFLQPEALFNPQSSPSSTSQQHLIQLIIHPLKYFISLFSRTPLS